MVVMAIWFVPMSHGEEEADSPSGRINNPGWYDARATFYGDITGAETQRKFKYSNFHYHLILFV